MKAYGTYTGRVRKNQERVIKESRNSQKSRQNQETFVGKSRESQDFFLKSAESGKMQVWIKNCPKIDRNIEWWLCEHYEGM